ncbi:uncharacterized protein LOC132315730 isoform X2 [Cornus florida]|uniref:uncharacterized protein LOC132315730 isoform X2 n=1 Tax=Cornus florida TaxID=4283 RepID=UPI00289DC171|nr:uncharacterized protein LOC132315730 isoform X2 [Cornus florida]
MLYSFNLIVISNLGDDCCLLILRTAYGGLYCYPCTCGLSRQGAGNSWHCMLYNGVVVYTCPFYTMWQVTRQRNLQGFPFLPCVASLASSVMWLMYAFTLDKHDNYILCGRSDELARIEGTKTNGNYCKQIAFGTWCQISWFNKKVPTYLLLLLIPVVGAVIALAPASPSFLFRSRLRRKNLFRTQWRTPISFLGKKTMTKG